MNFSASLYSPHSILFIDIAETPHNEYFDRNRCRLLSHQNMYKNRKGCVTSQLLRKIQNALDFD